MSENETTAHEDTAWPRDMMSRVGRLGRATMEVVVELGRARIPLEDVLNAEPGSIFETDKLSGMPMEIFVNDVLFARGETVVVGDQLAVRVTDLVKNENR